MGVEGGGASRLSPVPDPDLVLRYKAPCLYTSLLWDASSDGELLGAGAGLGRAVPGRAEWPVPVAIQWPLQALRRVGLDWVWC